MWYTLRKLPEVDLDFVGSVTELLQSTSRNLILVVGTVYLVWHLVATVMWPVELGGNVLLVTLVVILTCVFSIRLLSKQLLAAQVVWQTGLAVAITLGIVVFQQPAVGFLYALLPLMAAVTVGWPACLLAEGLVIGLVWWLSHSSVMPPLFSSHSLGIVIGGALTGLIGWIATHTLLTVTQWSLFYSEQAWQKVEEARDQQVELEQVQEDLILANQELARLSDRLKAMHLVAEEARRAKEEFVANVSHELRTPLNMIIGFSEMITQSPQVYGANLSPALLSDIAAIHLNSQHLSSLVDDVLDLSQVEAGRMALSKEWTSLQTIIDAAILAVRALFESKGLDLKAEVPPDLPPIFCDSTRVRQVVLNLLSNAGRYTERGGVRIKAWREKDAVVVSVTDTGPGIALENQKKIFEPFQQLDGSIRRRHGGSGLGLSISKRFVDMHGGKMWLESPSASLRAGPLASPFGSAQGGLGTGEGGPGATFYFSLPLETPLPAALAGGDAKRWFSPYDEFEYRVRTRRFKAPAPTVVPRFVLLEEGETLQRLFSRYLHGFEIVSVRDIEQAILELSHLPAQALVMNSPPFEEMVVPMDRLTNLPYGTPAVTCWVPGEDETARRLGVVHYLVKPVTRETLLSTLENLGEGVKSVLLVDDQLEALQLFARMLSSAGRSYRVLRAENGQRALSLLRQRRPDVMLLDLIMPGMDGFQVLQEKSQDPTIREIPVVVISARDPTGEPIVSDTLTVTRSGGLSVRDLLACIQAVSEILSPSGRLGNQGQPGKLAA